MRTLQADHGAAACARFASRAASRSATRGDGTVEFLADLDEARCRVRTSLRARPRPTGDSS